MNFADCQLTNARFPHYDWSEWQDDARKIFQSFRSPASEELILDKNYFVELVLPNSVIRKMTSSEMDVY
jgi:haloalkane dehalogenase